MITRRGIGFVLVAIAVFFVASATRVGWLHVADAMLWGIIILSATVPWLTVPKLEVARSVHPPRRRSGDVAPVVGDELSIELSVVNNTRFPRYFLSASQMSFSQGDSETRQKFFFARIPGRKNRSSIGTLACDRRGWRHFGEVVLEARLPFGLFRRRRRIAVQGRVLVHPRWFHMDRVGLIGANAGDSSSRRRARRGDEISGSRRYVFGDTVRDIHWKNTARTGRPSVKQYDAGAEDSVIVALDLTFDYGEGSESTLEYASTLCASVARAISSRGGAVSVATGSDLSQPTFDWSAVMHTLAVAERDPGSPMSASLKDVLPGQRVFSVISSKDISSISTLSSLSRRGAAVAAVVLEGFTEEDEARAAVGQLQQAGVAVVSCARGEIQEALTSIESGITHRTASRASTDKSSMDIAA
ncbi:MAG: DUF58 domain-containing protein [Chloroflexi bacterium]|nr:DUF58 domain-containing protein [Chloroflexota bacterium]